MARSWSGFFPLKFPMAQLSSLKKQTQSEPAPELRVSAWLNTREPLTLSVLKGKVVALHAFQMLCPPCVLHSIPQAKLLLETFRNDDLQVIGLHSVFEHHKSMSPEALAVFSAEYRLPFPVAIDSRQNASPIPETMEAYNMQGTPTVILIDRQGKIRAHHFGLACELTIASQIGALLAE